MSVQVTAVSEKQVSAAEEVVVAMGEESDKLAAMDDSYRLCGFHDRMEAYFVRLGVLHWPYRQDGTSIDHHSWRKSVVQAELIRLSKELESLKKAYLKNKEYTDRVELGLRVLNMTPEERAEYNSNRKKEG